MPVISMSVIEPANSESDPTVKRTGTVSRCAGARRTYGHIAQNRATAAEQAGGVHRDGCVVELAVDEQPAAIDCSRAGVGTAAREREGAGASLGQAAGATEDA